MKKRQMFSANIGSFDIKTKNTFEKEYIIHLFRIETLKTVLTFLPPIPCPITKFSTVCETKHRSIHLSKTSNMKYTHITVDVGTAEKHFKALWINPDEFKDVIIYLRDFHYFMHFFFLKIHW